MNITYITKTDKNGKPLYYRVTDGKKKVISRAAYEAHQREIETADLLEQSETQTELNTQITLDEVPAVEDSGSNSENEDEQDSDISALAMLIAISEDTLKAAGKTSDGKIRLREYKNCTLVKYRNCMICAVLYNANKSTLEIEFMGTSLETRNKSRVVEVASIGELNSLKDEISKQTAFIDWWWANTATAAKAS